MISYVAPPMSNGADLTVLLKIGAMISPGTFDTTDPEADLRIWVDGDAPSDDAQDAAMEYFQVALGALRVWRLGAGELVEEDRAQLGYGPARNDKNTTFAFARTAIAYAVVGGDVQTFATRVRAGITSDDRLAKALWLNGRARRNSADYWMIYEYAKSRFSGRPGVQRALKISEADQDLLKESVNNLSPLRGGRHAEERRKPPWSLERQRAFATDLLHRWIDRYG